MTCEVAVMNGRGIALAADSAVTLGEGRKIYLTAEKLFELAPSLPVGVMTYGKADLTLVPWETVIAGYRSHLGDRRYDTLAEYLSDFVTYIEGASMFPDDVQREGFAYLAERLWNGFYAERWKKQAASHRHQGDGDRYEVLRRLIIEDHPKWEQDPPLQRVDPGFPEAVVAEYEDALKQTERKLFGPDALPADISESLRKTLRLFLSHDNGFIYSGLVIAGMGEAEHFPSLLHYAAGPLIKGRLRLHPFKPMRITRGGQAAICPFGHPEIINTIIQGIHPNLLEDLTTFLSDSLDHAARGGAKDGVIKRFQDRLDQEIHKTYSSPFVDAVAAMPRSDLAVIAEVLVNLTAFRAHASVSEPETVGGPIDVALVSKSEGFVWIKRKRLGAATAP